MDFRKFNQLGKIKKFTAAVLAFSFLNAADNTELSVKCYNGTFVGSKQDNVLSFKGIPYAQPPVGDLRWKAPKSVEKSDKVFEAKSFGKAALQPMVHSEPVSINPKNLSEDALTLNIWTTGKTDKKKPVMFWIHGGAYKYSGSRETLYNAYYMVSKNPDIVVVTINYRLGLMGFVDFSMIEGGQKFKTSGYNGLLDQIEALKWVKQNIENFGGDPDNITIFGESAGGGSVCALMAAKGTQGLFKRAIAQSGCLNFTYTHESFARFKAADLLLKKAKAKNMDDLMKLSEDELFKIYLDESDGESLSYFSYAPLRGDESILPADPYKAILEGASKDVDLMIGTTADEYNYFIYDLLNPSKKDEKHELLPKSKERFSKMMLDNSIKRFYNMCNDGEKARIDEYFALRANKEKFWQKLDLMSEIGFRAPAIEFAQNHAKAGGKTYMYYFAKKNTSYDWIGASHSCELPYVFYNFNKEEEKISGRVLPGLANQVNGAWVNFAKNGEPSYDGINWPIYSLERRETMMFRDDGTAGIENDPLKKERELIVPMTYHYMGL